MMTDLDVLYDAVKTIDSLNIPGACIESIGFPLAKVRRNLQALINAIEKMKAEQRPEPEGSSEPVSEQPDETEK